MVTHEKVWEVLLQGTRVQCDQDLVTKVLANKSMTSVSVFYLKMAIFMGLYHLSL